LSGGRTLRFSTAVAQQVMTFPQLLKGYDLGAGAPAELLVPDR
jgi:hypothetical protein